MAEKKPLMNPDVDVFSALMSFKLFKFGTLACVGMVAWMLVAQIIVSSTLTGHEVPYSYGMDRHGQVIHIVPLSNANMRTSSVGSLLESFVEDTFSFDPVNYREQIAKAGSLYFTPNGYISFEKALGKEEGFLARVLQFNAITTAMVKGTPTLVGAKLLNGRYAWKMSLRLSIDFKGPDSHDVQDFQVTAVLTRQSIGEYEHGLAIESLEVSSGGTSR